VVGIVLLVGAVGWGGIELIGHRRSRGGPAQPEST
jgi:hypothetical protein